MIILQRTVSENVKCQSHCLVQVSDQFICFIILLVMFLLKCISLLSFTFTIFSQSYFLPLSNTLTQKSELTKDGGSDPKGIHCHHAGLAVKLLQGHSEAS